MKRAIVLSGGGSKGAYEVGVWKALNKLNIDYDIVTGTSVGALNGALMVQKDFRYGLKLWKQISFNKIFHEKLENTSKTTEVIGTVSKNMLQNGGMDVSKLQKLVENVVDLKKIYFSPIDFGLVTVNLSSWKPIMLQKKNIPYDKFCDYLMASATCFPAFQIKNIDGNSYIDGGYYDNLPINLAIKMGATEIIAVDLHAIGIKQKIIDKSVKITYITPKCNLAPILVFDEKEINKSINLGYNDTMKIFKMLDGERFTFKRNDIVRNYNKYNNKFINNLENVFNINKNRNLADELLKIRIFKRIMNKNETISKKEFINIIDNLGKVFKLQEDLIYGYRKFNRLLYKKLKSTKSINRKEIEKKIKNKDFKSLMSTDWIIKYIYEIIEDIIHGNQNKYLIPLALALPKEFLCAMYIYTTKRTLFDIPEIGCISYHF